MRSTAVNGRLIQTDPLPKGGLQAALGYSEGGSDAEDWFGDRDDGRGVGACAGRAPQPVAVVQPQDRYSDCAAITAEIEPTTKRSASLLPSKASRSVKTSPPGLRAWWFGRCSLPWIFRIQPARKSPRCKVASNTLRAWRSRNALLPHRRILLRFASTDRAAAGREETSPTDFGAADFGARDLYWAGSLRDRRVAQCVGRKAAVLTVRSLKPGALDDFFSLSRHADNGHGHPRTPRFQLDRISNLKRHYRPPNWHRH